MSFDPEGRRLPIKLDSTSNGEFAPLPVSQATLNANRLADVQASEYAKRLAKTRREFLLSACGAASTLLASNTANAAAGRDGGYFDVDPRAALDVAAADEALAGSEFIFDVQGHFIGDSALSAGDKRGGKDFVKDVFLDSDTDMMVLSFVPSNREREPLSIEEADGVRRIVDTMEGTHRLLLHGRVNPNQDGDLQGMDELAERYGVSAWKTYTQWGPDGEGYSLADERVGLPFIEKARALNVPVICIHKGVPFAKRSYEHSLCDDVGKVAVQYPDITFIVYHSGWVPGLTEQAYDKDNKRDGIDSLVRTLLDNNIGPNSNVYAELGTTWRGLMQDPTAAAHGLGKLIKHAGENNVLWGSDSIWYGSPQDQIQAFRSFQIAESLREQHGYAKITPELRAKIFGINATRPYQIDMEETRRVARHDTVAKQREAYAEHPDPHYTTFGPRTRREFLDLLRARGGSPV